MVRFYIILTTIFIVLKLAGVVTWSWVWILSPLWLPWIVSTILIILIGAFVTLLVVFGLIPRNQSRW
jgi:hypothetical protein